MNVLLVVREFSPSGDGGISYHVTHLSKALQNQGHDVTVLCSEPASDIPETSSIKDIHTVEPRSYLPQQPAFSLAARDSVPKIVQNLDIDLVQFHSPGWWFSLPEVVQIYKVHMCFSANFDLLRELSRYRGFRGIPRSLIYDLYARTVSKPMESGSLSAVDGVIYNSDLSRTQIRERFHVELPGETIPNGIDPTIFSPQPADKSEPYFLHVGGSKIKGIDILLDAWDQYEGPVDQLKIAGGISVESDRVRAERTDSVIPVGKVSQTELAQLYTNAEALVHPARYEPFGNVVYEAVACGTPVITTKETVGAASYLPSEYYIEFSHKNRATLVTALERVRGNWQRPPSTLLDEFVEKNSWDRVATETIQFASQLRSSH